MKACRSKEIKSPAFTLVELLVIVAVLGLLSCLILPALARAKPKSITAQCLSNKKQVQMADSMYETDNNDFLVPNNPASQPGSWVQFVPNEDWSTQDANTNPAPYLLSSFAPYVGNNVLAYRCPGDNLPSQNGFRIKSISMNGQVGTTPAHNANLGYKLYQRVSDFTDASKIWVFCDESFWSMNDGWLQVSLTTSQFPDAPAAYHDSGNCFSFADGHAAFRQWKGAHVTSLTSPIGLLGVVYQTGVVRSGATMVPTGSTDPDWLWLKAHSADPN